MSIREITANDGGLDGAAGSGALKDSDYRIEDLKIVSDTNQSDAVDALPGENRPLGSVFDVAKIREDSHVAAKKGPSESDRLVIRASRAGRFFKFTFFYLGLCGLTMGAAMSLGQQTPGPVLVAFAILVLFTYAFGVCWLIRGILGLICSLIWPPRRRLFVYLAAMILALVGSVALHILGMSIQTALGNIRA